MSRRKGTRAGQNLRTAPSARQRGRTARDRQNSRRTWIGFGAAGAILIAVIVAVALGTSNSASKASSVSEGQSAPDGAFTTSAGQTRTISSLHGQPTLVWFVATWCSSCQAGTQAMSGQIRRFASHHVRVVELELYEDLGQSGPSIDDFARRWAGPAAANPDWSWGVASSALTNTYDPAGYLDIYYLLDSSGHVVFVDSSPASTMEALLAHVGQV